MSRGNIPPLTSAQIRAARALLRWSAEELARASALGIATIWRAELTERQTSLTAANDLAIRHALEFRRRRVYRGERRRSGRSPARPCVKATGKRLITWDLSSGVCDSRDARTRLRLSRSMPGAAPIGTGFSERIFTPLRAAQGESTGGQAAGFRTRGNVRRNPITGHVRLRPNFVRKYFASG